MSYISKIQGNAAGTEMIGRPRFNLAPIFICPKPVISTTLTVNIYGPRGRALNAERLLGTGLPYNF